MGRFRFQGKTARLPHLFVFSFVTYPLNFFLYGQLVETGQGKTHKEADSAVEHRGSVAKSARYLIGGTFDSGRVGNAPMSGQRLP